MLTANAVLFIFFNNGNFFLPFVFCKKNIPFVGMFL